MSGVHGRNCELRISTGETIRAGVALIPHPDPFLASRGVFKSPDRNWKWVGKGEPGAARVTYESPAGITKEIDSNSFNIHYADGSVRIPPEDLPGLVAGTVRADYVALQMEQIGNLLSDEREFELNLEAELVDTTTIGENYKSFAEGIGEWSGTLTGLYLNAERFKLAQPVSGIIPRKNLRLRPRPDQNTYWQGNVIFPKWGISGGFDSVIERSTEFTGSGPLDLIEDGKPVFPGLS